MKKSRPLAPRGGNDKVYTPDDLALKIVNHFNPTGKILEPCAGKGAFVRAMPGCDKAELDDGVDFFNLSGKWDWIVSNPPWGDFRAFLNHSMKLTDNVVFLSLVNAFFMKARVRDMRRENFGIVEIFFLPTPKHNWPQTGFALGATHIQRGYVGKTLFTYDKDV